MKRYLLYMIATIFTANTAYGYEAHEWGTFTSLVGSDGRTQNGMHHEDEALPDFVHGFGETQFVFNPIVPPDGCPVFSKACFFMETLENNIISQKMETPVIYFYGDQTERVTVNVNFPEGIITETYPAPVFSTPKNSEDLVIANGQAQFMVDLLPGSTLTPAVVDEKNIYGHARKTDSLLIRTNGEVEKFIFYRGVGRFQPQFGIHSVGRSLTLNIPGQHFPQAAFLVDVKEGEATHMLPIIGPGSPIKATTDGHDNFRFFVSDKSISQLQSGEGGYVKQGPQVKESLVQALVRSGLFTDEALAMVNTWENGYFKTPGLRILYILPRAEVEQVLPLTMSPVAEKIERSFVARIEVMLEDEEIDLVNEIIRQQENFKIQSLGRFAEPRLRRAREVYRNYVIAQSPIKPMFEPGHFNLFDDLVEKSITAEPAPLVID